MSSKVFEDEQGGIWIVTKTGTNLEVQGWRKTSESLYQIARSCAVKLGIFETKAGVPIKSINEQRRLWNSIWGKGRDA